MNAWRSRSGRSTLAIVIVVCAVVFLVFGLLSSVGLFVANGFRDFWHDGEVRIGVRQDVDEKVSYDLEGVDRIEIATVSADAVVRTGGTDTVEARLKGTAHTFAGSVRLVAEKTGSTLRIRIDYPRFGSVSSDLDYTIDIPSTYLGQLRVGGVSSRIVVEDPGFACTRFEAATVSGDIRVRGLRATSYDVSTTSGSCDMTGVAGAFTGRSVSGDFTVEADAAATFRVDTVSGDASLSLPAGAEFDFEYDTVSGNFRCDFESIVDSTRGKNVEGHVGGGGEVVSVKSVSGGFTILER